MRERCERLPAPTLELACDDAAVEAEPDRLASVLEHLIQNAQEATPEQGEVRVRLGRDADAGCAVIDIEDTGCGMDAEFIAERLFRPFETTKGNAGMGIGVYESREFVRGLGGRIDVTSTPGEGTAFKLMLPLAAASPPGGADTGTTGVSMEVAQ